MSTFYEEVFRRALLALNGLPARPRESDLVQRCDRLLSVSEPQRATLLRNSVSFACPDVARWLVDLAFSLRYEDPITAVRVASVAREVADGLAEGPYALLATDIRAHAYAFLGNALRTAGELEKARQWSLKALALATDGSGDPICWAEAAMFHAGVLVEERRFKQAIRLYWQSFRAYQEVEELHLAGRVLVSLGRALAFAGESEASATVLHHSFAFIEPEREPEVVVGAGHFLAQALAGLGREPEAMRVLRSVAPLCAQIRGPVIAARARWMEATVLSEVGRYRESARILRSVAAEFQESGLRYDSALVHLDLVGSLLSDGDFRAAAKVAASLYPQFLSQGLADRALAALLAVQQAARQEALSAVVLQEATKSIRSAQRAEWGERLQSLGAR